MSKFKATVGNNMVWISPLGMPVSQYSYEQKPKNYDKYDCWEMNLTLSKSEIIDNFIGYYPQERESFQFVISMTDRTALRQRLTHFNSAQNLKNASIFGVSIFGVPIFNCIFPKFFGPKIDIYK